MAAPGAFEKDFGYLMPFLEKVAAAASELEDAAAREELARLMAEEKGRWARIRELLGGAAGKGVAEPVAAEEAPEPAVKAPGPLAKAPTLARASGDDVSRLTPLGAGFTVGSLKGQR